jgi:hypothetical protein
VASIVAVHGPWLVLPTLSPDDIQGVAAGLLSEARARREIFAGNHLLPVARSRMSYDAERGRNAAARLVRSVTRWQAVENRISLIKSGGRPPRMVQVVE